MSQSITASNLRLRRSYARTHRNIDVPNLIELQRQSYENFLQQNTSPDKRDNIGLHSVFKSVFPVSDFNNTASLDFVSYVLEPPKYDVDECRQRGMSFAAPVKVTFRLMVFDVDEATEERSIRDVKEQEVYLGEIPLMTASGSFIINGTERVVVSQLHRSPGVFFDHDKGKNTTATGKLIYSARVIPYRGSWLDFEFDQKDLLYVRIDRRRKFPATILLKALGYSTEELLNYYYHVEVVRRTQDGRFERDLDIEKLAGQRMVCDIVHPDTGEVLVKAGRRVTRVVVRKVQEANVKKVYLQEADLEGKVLARPLIDESTGEIIADSNDELSPAVMKKAQSVGLNEYNVIFFDGLSVGPYLRNTVLVDKVHSREEALLDIYRRMRPGEPPTIEAAEVYFHRLFFAPEVYDLSEVGRLKINHRFDISLKECSLEHRVLTKKDILQTVKTLIDLKNGHGSTDDIDHLGNRRVRSVGELLENQYRIGLVRMERAVRERMSLQDLETMMPHDLVNAKPVSAVVKEFFGSSQLSQFMDQTNPLSEVTHKRRLSALGPGGLTRDRAGFEVRDVHPTHYGRICPIETPEGPNIGLIASLATYARINKYGFIETPYRKVENAKVGKKYDYMSALEEQGHHIAQAGLDTQDEIKPDNLTVRVDGEYETVSKDKVSLADVSPSQLVSIAASMIPFLEHDDANRALMGSNMQRQAVPLLRAQAPLVGTGVERLVGRDAGTNIVCMNDGVVDLVDAERIVVRRLAKGGSLSANADVYKLTKYQRTNQNTCFNQRPIVKLGDKVHKGDVIADGPSSELGEASLGANVLVAFAPWMGYNFEDSILISDRLIRDDTYTSIHIEEFECVARDTKLGKEEITRDIANIGEEALSDLDTSGIVRIGAEVKPGSILVGKVTPKSETQLSPEEKLLRAIFGEKAGDVRDTSLRVPSGVSGTVIDAQVYSRESKLEDERLKLIIESQKARLEKDVEHNLAVVRNTALDKLKTFLVGQKTTGVLLSEDGAEELLASGQKIKSEDLESIPFQLLSYIPLEEKLEKQCASTIDEARRQMDAVELVSKEKIERLSRGDELPPGVIKMVKVHVAIKRKLQVGDKFAGRHGNKGVISRVMPQEDMPYLDDGTPVDMVLNPLGVPSRMNIGQVLEIHLGWAAYALGRQLEQQLEVWKASEARKALKQAYDAPDMNKKIDQANEASLKKMLNYVKHGLHFATPVFDGAWESDVKSALKRAGLPSSGQAILHDGRTGEAFDTPVTVGVMYMLKLHHLVEEKIHARSIGPYSLVSQQPLGGKAQFGGQRLGEMEVWAIEAYGAAYALQEFLTVKSDDVAGRTRMYESIVKGENVLEPGLPESFNVLVKELQSLALNVDLVESDLLTDNPEIVSSGSSGVAT